MVYVFIREDLTHPQQVVQASHAVLATERPVTGVPCVIVIGVKNEEKLLDVMPFLDSNKVSYKAFREPDFGNELTAIATEPLTDNDRHLFKKFQLLRNGKHA